MRHTPSLLDRRPPHWVWVGRVCFVGSLCLIVLSVLGAGKRAWQAQVLQTEQDHALLSESLAQTAELLAQELGATGPKALERLSRPGELEMTWHPLTPAQSQPYQTRARHSLDGLSRFATVDIDSQQAGLLEIRRPKAQAPETAYTVLLTPSFAAATFLLALGLFSRTQRVFRTEDASDPTGQPKPAVSDARMRSSNRLAVVGQVAVSLAHQMGTPLNVIAGHAMLLQEAKTRDIAKNTRIIVEQAQRIEALIRRLLNYARARGMGKQAIDVRQTLQEARELFFGVALKRNVTLELQATDASMWVLADPELLLQVASDLIMNGIESMHHGTLTLSIAQLGTLPEAVGGGAFVKLSIQDQGQGVPPEHRDAIFEPFFTTKSQPEGMGLGLTVSSAIVREHGGWIDFHSEVGIGSRFDVYLPLAEAPCRAAS